MSLPRLYVVVVDDPQLLRRHRITLGAENDVEAERAAARVAVAADWFDAPYASAAGASVTARIERDPEGTAEGAALYAIAYPGTRGWWGRVGEDKGHTATIDAIGPLDPAPVFA